MEGIQVLVFITGASQGVGFQIASQLLDYPGYKILIGCLNFPDGLEAVKILKGRGLPCEAFQIDVTDDTSIKHAAESVANKYGRLDILINNAGIAHVKDDSRRLRDIMQEVFNINTFGAAQTTEEFLPLLRLSKRPRILFVSSDLASLTLASDPHYEFYRLSNVAYRTSKAALNMLMVQYSVKLKDEGFQVHSVNPGLCSTNLNGFMADAKSPDLGAKAAVIIATKSNASTGTYTDIRGVLPW